MSKWTGLRRLSFASRSRAGGAAAAFTPASLFAASEAGAWYDPSDLSTLWQDTGGTVAVTADGQNVARMDDKSGNDNHATQATSSLRPVYKEGGGLRWLLGDGVDDLLTVASSTGSFNFMHNGLGGLMTSGVRVGTVADPETLYGITGNNGAAAFGVGFTSWWDDRNAKEEQARLQINTGSELILIIASNNTQPPNTDAVRTDTYISQAGDDGVIYIDGVMVDSDDSSGTPSTANATSDLDIFAAGNENFPLSGRLFGLVLAETTDFNGVRNDLEPWMADKTGVTL